MPNQNPYLIKENHKKVEEIQELEVKQSPLSPVARSKVIRK